MTTTFADRAFDLQQQGHDPDDIATQLVKEGASPGLARICVRDLDWGSDHDAGSTSADTGVAMLWLMGGLLVTGLTFAAAAAGGGKFIIAAGPIVYDLTRLFRS